MSQLSHEHGHEDEHDHEHDHEHEHEHDHPTSLLGGLRALLPFGHSHSHSEMNADDALEGSDRGRWALKVSLLGLGTTAILQLIVVLVSGSVGLLADTIHNFADAFTAVPLWIAFSLGQRAVNRRYTYGYGRAEDIAGVIIVLVIFLSAVLAAYESLAKFFNPQPVTNLGWVALAAIVGFLGNEAVAVFRIRVGNEIGSAALVADGQHARADGITSLAVLLGVIGVALGFPAADAMIGLLISIAILFIVRDTAATMWQRLMDGVDPAMVSTIEQTASAVAEVQAVHDIQLRWIGHQLHAELSIIVDQDLPTLASHQIAEQVRHALFHALPRLSEINVHVDPGGHSDVDAHTLTAHHARNLGRYRLGGRSWPAKSSR